MSIYDKASLVLIPSGTKTSKVYSQKPTNGDGDFTFSRSTAATRVNASGNIEKETQNLLLQSNSFDTTWQNVFTANVVGGQNGYDGTSDAWTLETQSGQASRIIQNTAGLGSVNSLSVYAKANTLDWIRLQISTATGNYVADFDLTNGVSGYTFGSPLPSIQSIGSGWYRVTISGFAPPTQVRIYAASGNNDLGGAGTIYIQDAQLEQGLVARDYIETTTTAIYGGITDNVPRLDYTDSSCPALLLEPQRTNSITHSEYFGAWTPSGLTITDNDAASPEGVSNAAKLTLPSGSAAKRIALGSMPVTAVARSYSFFVKSDDITAVQLVHSGDIQGYARFNISTGAVGSTGSKTTSTIEDYGNGWYRCIANFDSTNAFGSTIYLYINDSATGGYGGSTSAQGDLFVYGAQYEAGSYATSYIPTYGSAVTRNADAASKTGISSLIGQTEGTLFFEFNLLSEPSDGTNVLASISDASVNNRVTLLLNTIGNLRILLNGSGTQELDRSITAPSGNTKIAFAYKSGENALYVNGVQEWTTTDTFTFSTLSRFGFNDYDGDPYANNPLKKSLVFKTRLTNAELATLTTI